MASLLWLRCLLLVVASYQIANASRPRFWSDMCDPVTRICYLHSVGTTNSGTMLKSLLNNPNLQNNWTFCLNPFNWACNASEPNSCNTYNGTRSRLEAEDFTGNSQVGFRNVWQMGDMTVKKQYTRIISCDYLFPPTNANNSDSIVPTKAYVEVTWSNRQPGPRCTLFNVSVPDFTLQGFYITFAQASDCMHYYNTHYQGTSPGHFGSINRMRLIWETVPIYVDGMDATNTNIMDITVSHMGFPVVFSYKGCLPQNVDGSILQNIVVENTTSARIGYANHTDFFSDQVSDTVVSVFVNYIGIVIIRRNTDTNTFVPARGGNLAVPRHWIAEYTRVPSPANGIIIDKIGREPEALVIPGATFIPPGCYSFTEYKAPTLPDQKISTTSNAHSNKVSTYVLISVGSVVGLAIIVVIIKTIHKEMNKKKIQTPTQSPKITEVENENISPSIKSQSRHTTTQHSLNLSNVLKPPNQGSNKTQINNININPDTKLHTKKTDNEPENTVTSSHKTNTTFVLPEKKMKEEALSVNTKQIHKKVEVNTTNDIPIISKNTQQATGVSSTSANTILKRSVQNIQTLTNKNTINKKSNRNTFSINFNPQTGARR